MSDVDLTFIFIEILLKQFCYNKSCTEMKNVASFIKARFYWQRDCIKMRKHAATFQANKGYKLAIVIFIPALSFSKWKFVVHLSNVICMETRSYTSLLFILKWITSALSFIWLEPNGKVFTKSFSPVGPVFLISPFLGVPFFLRSRFGVHTRFLGDAMEKVI